MKNKTTYDKPYIGHFNASILSNPKAGADALRKWEETQKYIKSREELLGE